MSRNLPFTLLADVDFGALLHGEPARHEIELVEPPRRFCRGAPVGVAARRQIGSLAMVRPPQT